MTDNNRLAEIEKRATAVQSWNPSEYPEFNLMARQDIPYLLELVEARDKLVESQSLEIGRLYDRLHETVDKQRAASDWACLLAVDDYVLKGQLAAKDAEIERLRDELLEAEEYVRMIAEGPR